MKVEGMSRSAEPESAPPSVRSVLALVAVALLLVAGFVFVVPMLPALVNQHGSMLASLLGSLQANSTQGQGTYSPLIENGSAKVSYPSDYGNLSAYAVSLINGDRSNFSLGGVTLSPNEAGQQHADSMLQYGYFSHYDTQGYKPYMRYTLLGGVGAVFENVAYVSYSNAYFTAPNDVKSALKALEWSMMYNDSVCCDNGHRANILNPLHDRVSIGIAFNATSLFFDEDFENYYVNMSVSTAGYVVTMQGPVLGTGISPQEALVAYDPPPVPETSSQLNNGPRDYGPGTVEGGVLPPCSIVCPVFSQGITVHASDWEFTPTDMRITFSLSQFVQRYGSGVYTIYLLAGTNTDSAITSISIFVR